MKTPIEHSKTHTRPITWPPAHQLLSITEGHAIHFLLYMQLLLRMYSTVLRHYLQFYTNVHITIALKVTTFLVLLRPSVHNDHPMSPGPRTPLKMDLYTLNSILLHRTFNTPVCFITRGVYIPIIYTPTSVLPEYDTEGRFVRLYTRSHLVSPSARGPHILGPNTSKSIPHTLRFTKSGKGLRPHPVLNYFTCSWRQWLCGIWRATSFEHTS
jgi:hypothetical protein